MTESDRTSSDRGERALPLHGGGDGGDVEHAGAGARQPDAAFDQWVDRFPRPRAARAASPTRPTPRVMGNIKPDTVGLMRSTARSPNSTRSSGNISTAASPTGASPTGKEKAKEYAPLLARIEKDYGVERSVMLGLWGIESAFGDPDRPEEPHAAGHPGAGRARLGRAAPARLLGAGTAQRAASSSSAAGARRRRCAAPGPAPWATPNGCRRSGSTSGVDYDGDGRVSPFGKPDDALAGTAQYLVKRGKYRARRALGLRGARRAGTSGGKRRAATRPGRRPA